MSSLFPGTVLEVATTMLSSGLEPIPLKPRSKDPLMAWKEPVTWDSATLADRFRPDTNIGVALGARSSGLVDVDFDLTEAALLGRELLSTLPSFGRASSRSSHRLAYSEGIRRELFQLPAEVARELSLDRTTILEIRGDGHQTMFPPSTHPSGEQVEWEVEHFDPPTLAPDKLKLLCGRVAALSLVLRAYPRVKGDRDNVCLALAGALVRSGFEDTEADAAVTMVARLAGDEEWQQRGNKAAATRSRIAQGGTAWGLPELCARIGLQSAQGHVGLWLGASASETTDISTASEIVLMRGMMHQAVDEAEHALLKSGVALYQRGDMLVRPVRLHAMEASHGVSREAGQLVLRGATGPWITEQLSRAATWWRVSAEGSRTRIDPPGALAGHYLQRVGEWSVPPLIAITQTPTLRPDGSTLQKVGYDVLTRLLYEPGEMEFDAVPGEPTRDQAAAALAMLTRPFREVAFADEASRSVALAALLTGLIRRTLPTAPLFAIDAPTAGSGKSMIAETIGIIVTGVKPALMSQGKTDEEDEKRLTSVLMAGDAVIVLDNCERPITGDFLASMLTGEVVQARVLGKSEVVRLPTKALVIATGNNMIVRGDMTRRTIVCRLDPKIERPEDRSFDFDPRKEVAENRAQLVVAGLTVLRAYIAAGRPLQVAPLGSFEDWSLVREALIWLGLEDPVKSRERLVSVDPERDDLMEILRLWIAAFGNRRVKLAEIVDELSGPTQDVKKLISKLNEVTGQREYNPRSAGRKVSQYVDRVIGGLVLRRGGGTSSHWYQVESLVSNSASDSNGTPRLEV